LYRYGEDVELPRTFARMTYADAMSRYGCDKPDVRYGLELKELADVVKGTGFKLFSGVLEAGGTVKAIAVPEGKRLSNSRLKPKAGLKGKL
jgi:aspartyl-tRNA synthetase